MFLKYKNSENITMLLTSEYHNKINLNEFFPKIKINLTISIYDFYPRVLCESLSYGCFNILFDNMYTGPHLIKDNPEFGYLIDMKKYGLQDVNKVKVENTYINKFKDVWKDILNVIINTNIDHVKNAEIFNLKYNIDSKNALIENL